MISPGKLNSNRIIIDNPNPIDPPVQPARKYVPPIKI
jgi:hypothetical protein